MKDKIGLLQEETPAELPLIPLLSTMIFPLGVSTIQVGSPKNIALLRDNPGINTLVVLAYAQSKDSRSISSQDISDIGVVSRIIDMLNIPGGSIQVTFQGLRRVCVTEFSQEEPYFKARVSYVMEEEGDPIKINALIRKFLDLFEHIVETDHKYPRELLYILRMNLEDPGRLADLAATYLNVEYKEKQEILESLNTTTRLEKVIKFLQTELERTKVSQDINRMVQINIEKGQREYYLRQELKAIKSELGEEDFQESEAKIYLERISQAKIPKEAETEAKKEVERLRMVNPSSPEYNIIRTYLDWIASLPWTRSSKEEIDLPKVQRALDEKHYGLEKVKERILEHLAVRKLNENAQGPILCFVGPPGTGKTSLGQSIAQAIGRKFIRMSVGGVRDEAVIRGHRRTYVGAMPGKIIENIRRADFNNPLIMIDEIDKISRESIMGDPSAALLEVLDPEQNTYFMDHYLNLPFDLSKVMFITTANVTYNIIPPLLDRMEVINLSGYTEEEKLIIARNYLLPRSIKNHGLDPEGVNLEDRVMKKMIRDYTREAGLRNLQREIASLCRKCAREKAEGKEFCWNITEANLEKFLGPPQYTWEEAQKYSEVGVATGLVWTSNGGDILIIETLKMKGRGNLTVTGHLGEVMMESVKAAHSYVRSRAEVLGIEPSAFENYDIHIHFPAGAIPKDGPSAGVTITLAIASLLSERPVKHNVAITGEVSLRGRVLPIGGLKEKVLAAYRAGIDTVMLPKDNEKDLLDIPQEVKDRIKFILIQKVDEVFKEALSTFTE